MELVEEIKKAVEYTKNREYKKAEKIYKTLLKENPKNDSILSFLGLLYFNQFMYDKAEKYLLKAYNITKSDKIASYIGLSKYFLTRFESAVPYLEEAIINSKSQEIYLPLIVCCSRCHDYNKAYTYALEAQKKFPFNQKILYELAYNSLQSGRFKECEIYNNNLQRLNPKMPGIWFIKGLISEVLYGDEAQAREYYREMEKCGDKIGSYLNLAISYSKDEKHRKETLYYLKKTEKLKKNKAGLRFMYAAYYLSNRQFTKGYKYYVASYDMLQDDIDWVNLFKRPWTGGAFKDEILFVYGDQGLGDQIQFSRYIPFLEKQFKEIRVMVAEPLLSIFKRSFKSCKKTKFYPRNNKFPRYNKSVQLANSIYYLNKKFNAIPFTDKYMISDKNKVAEFRTKYFNTDKYKIGICWEAGSTGIRDQIHRTLNVELFEKIIKFNKAQIYSLQVNPSLDNYKKYTNLIDLNDKLKTFDDTAAALENLDIMITVDTSTAHLAGALGIKTFLILPYCPDWRWFDNTETTEWYDSIRIFKQKNHNDWDEVFERIYNELNNSI